MQLETKCANYLLRYIYCCNKNQLKPFLLSMSGRYREKYQFNFCNCCNNTCIHLSFAPCCLRCGWITGGWSQIPPPPSVADESQTCWWWTNELLLPGQPEVGGPAAQVEPVDKDSCRETTIPSLQHIIRNAKQSIMAENKNNCVRKSWY